MKKIIPVSSGGKLFDLSVGGPTTIRKSITDGNFNGCIDAVGVVIISLSSKSIVGISRMSESALKLKSDADSDSSLLCSSYKTKQYKNGQGMIDVFSTDILCNK